jgi:hypothetical protein
VTYYRGDPKIAAIVHHWDDLVESYTNKTLTFPLDRTLAISALASEFGRVLDDVYLAGILYLPYLSLLDDVIWGPTSTTSPVPRTILVVDGGKW